MPVAHQPPGSRRQARRRLRVAQDRSAGRRDGLALDAVVDQRDALQQQRGRGCGHRQGAVAAGDAAAADGQRCCRPLAELSITKAAPTMSAIEFRVGQLWNGPCLDRPRRATSSASAAFPVARAPALTAGASGARPMRSRISTYMPWAHPRRRRADRSRPGCRQHASRCARWRTCQSSGRPAARIAANVPRQAPARRRGWRPETCRRRGRPGDRGGCGPGAHRHGQASGRCTGTTYGPSGSPRRDACPIGQRSRCTASAGEATNGPRSAR